MEETPQERNDGKIIERDIEKEMRTAYIDYAMSVIVSRALPDARDGLKPVHRRILYAMHEDGITADKPYRKCANTVGSVLGRYHPHGDSSVYDAMVRMAQDFSMRYMLIDGHGNFGSVDGDGAAAMRYTEARMSKISAYMLTDIEKNTVNFMPNYDDRLQEPTVLPARIPALLINGSSGIAVGMATNIPPHNLTEVINGIIKIIDEDEVTDEDLMSVIKGPDFPTEGIILGIEGIKQAYKTGRGKITLRAETDIEEMSGNRQRIIVSSLPYQVNKANLIKTISDLSKEKKIEGISECRDESDRIDRVRVVIELKRDANAQVVLNQLFKHTQMQTTFGIIMLALVNGEPKILTLRQCLDCFIDHRKDVILRRTQFDLDKALARAHILEGLRIAIDYIDEVIQIIRSSYDDAKERLMKRFGLTDIQAQAILDMRLKTLSGLQREKIEEEYKQLMELIEHLRAVLASEKLVFDIIKEELIEIRDKFGDERKTKIVAAEGEIDLEDLIKEEQCVVALTHFGYIKRMPIDTYKSQRRGGKGITGIATREDDFVKQIFTASTHDMILFFTNKGKLYKLRGYEVPEAGRTAKGTAIVNLLSLDPGEKVSAVIPIQNFADGKYLLMATKNGLIKKTALKEYDTTRKTGLQGITLKDEDELIGVRLTDGEDNVVLVTKNGLCITFDEKDVRPIGRVSQGVIGIRLDDDDEVIGMESVIVGGKATLLAITENGFGKRTELDEYRVQKRGGRGVITYKITPKTGKIVAAEGEIDLEDLIKEEQCVVALTHFGYIKRMPIDTYKSQRRGGKGITGIATREDDFVKQIFTASTHDMILFFTNKGKLYKLRGYEVPEAGRTAKGTAIVNLLSLDPGEKVSAVIPIQNFADGKYLLMATKNGLIKKTALKEYDTTRKTGLQGITLKDEDELIGVRLTDGEDNVVLVTKNGLCITFDEKDVRPIGRVSQGVIGIRLDDDDEVIGMESVIVGGKATLLAITENGFGKRTELDEYRVQKRGGRGVITYKITPKTGKIVGVRIATEEDDVMLITDKGTIIRINVKDVSILGRSTQGVTLMRTNDGGKVVSIETLTPDIENE